jgi:hypothetical protein
VDASSADRDGQVTKGTITVRTVSGLLQAAAKPDEKNGAYYRDNDRADEAFAVNAEQAEEKSADYGTDDAENDIHQRAVATAFHDFARRPSGDEADENPPDQTDKHARFPNCATTLRESQVRVNLRCELRVGSEPGKNSPQSSQRNIAEIAENTQQKIFRD